MDTTDPLQGGPQPSPAPGADPVKQLAPKEPGAPRADDHDTSGPPAPEVIRRGYEEDVYDAKSVFSVPLMVILFFVLAFGTVSILFAFLAYPGADPNAHPGAAERNKAPLNERIGRYKRGGEVDQPPLEPMRQRSGDARAITRPEIPGVNSPELHPEELRPTKDRYPGLYSTGWADPGKTTARIGLDVSMKLDAPALKQLLPSRENDRASRPTDSRHRPTASNAGRAPLPTPPADAKKDEKKPDDKKPDEKKPEEKKPEDKKPDDKKPGDKKAGEKK